MGCATCGANIEHSKTEAVTCRFCGHVNAPLPTQVDVPVPVQIVHNVVHVSDGQTAVESRCPHCRKRLVGIDVEGVGLQGCGRCGGIWVDNASAQRILSQPRRLFVELSARAASHAQIGVLRVAHPICAVCPAALDKTHMQNIALDICPDHGTWFDAHELAQLTRLLVGEPRANPAATHVECAGCGLSIAAKQANITGDGPKCDRCWRQVQAQQVADWEADPQKAATGAAVALRLFGALVAGATAANRRS